MREMIYTPQRKPRKALIYILFLFLTALLFAALNINGFPFKWLFQAGMFLCLALFILTVTRYFIYEYRYIITDENFSIVQKSGNRETILCNLDLSTAVAVYNKAELKEHKKEIGHIKTSYNYTQNFMSDDILYYIFEFNGAKCSVAFEADEFFADGLKARIL
ncbi:MAG: hypothetical protein E7588_07660 [Ruminococcaceae bacterium]|nr:hypothetical protein [Oscillospiraceae bacterium]